MLNLPNHSRFLFFFDVVFFLAYLKISIWCVGIWVRWAENGRAWSRKEHNPEPFLRLCSTTMSQNIVVGWNCTSSRSGTMNKNVMFVNSKMCYFRWLSKFVVNQPHSCWSRSNNSPAELSDLGRWQSRSPSHKQLEDHRRTKVVFKLGIIKRYPGSFHSFKCQVSDYV